MKSIAVLLSLAFAAVAAVPNDEQRIVGGDPTRVDFYPSLAALLFGQDSSFSQTCGGTILNTRAILTAAHCAFGDAAARWRVRVGSTWSNWGGNVHTLAQITPHASYNRLTNLNDIAIMRTAAAIVYQTTVRPAKVANANYGIANNQIVWAIGWGTTSANGHSYSIGLRHVELRTINQAVCVTTYANVGRAIAASMLCIGGSNWGNRGQCRGDGGSPIFHNDVVVGVYSFSQECTTGRFPSINTRLANFAAWINTNSA